MMFLVFGKMPASSHGPAPMAYAQRRARAMIGVDEPEHIQVHDYLKINERIQKQCPENIQQDIFVELHFNGFYED